MRHPVSYQQLVHILCPDEHHVERDGIYAVYAPDSFPDAPYLAHGKTVEHAYHNAYLEIQARDEAELARERARAEAELTSERSRAADVQ